MQSSWSYTNFNNNPLQVEASYKALNLGDVFILDNGLDIYVWMPPQSGRLERIKVGKIKRLNYLIRE
jgi:hypothetical protein